MKEEHMSRSFLLLTISTICLTQLATADPASITNGTDWKDTDGNLIAAHDGGIASLEY